MNGMYKLIVSFSLFMLISASVLAMQDEKKDAHLKRCKKTIIAAVAQGNGFAHTGVFQEECQQAPTHEQEEQKYYQKLADYYSDKSAAGK